MLKDKNFWTIHLKWGAIFGVFLIILEIVKMFARKVDYQATQLLDIAMIIGLILILFYGVKEFKAVYTDRLSFAKAFLSTITISVIGAIIIFGYDLLHYSVIEKDGLQQKYTTALEKYKQNLAKDTLTADELHLYVDTATLIINNQKDISCNKIVNDTLKSEINNGILIFQQYYSKKILAKPENEKENYSLGEFSKYARRVLMETLVSYTEQNPNNESTAIIQTIIQNSNQQLQNADPLENRFELTKSRVPRYDKNGKYAAVSANIYLLYGMFLGIFVAMFHYRSKNPIEPIEDNEQNTENI